MPPRNAGKAPATPAPSAELARMLARIKTRKTEWERALAAPARAGDADADESAIRIGVKTVLPKLADDARAAPAALRDPTELRAFAEQVASLENDVVRCAYTADEYDGFDFIPVSCGEIVRDDAMGKTGNLGACAPS
jgi:hypothetical protein